MSPLAVWRSISAHHPTSRGHCALSASADDLTFIRAPCESRRRGGRSRTAGFVLPPRSLVRRASSFTRADCKLAGLRVLPSFPLASLRDRWRIAQLHVTDDFDRTSTANVVLLAARLLFIRHSWQRCSQTLRCELASEWRHCLTRCLNPYLAPLQARASLAVSILSSSS